MTRLSLFILLLWAANSAIVGKWDVISNDGGDQDLNWVLLVNEDSGKLSGSLTGANGDLPLIEPRLEGDLFTFKLHINDNCTVEAKLKLDGKKLKGTFACPEVTGTLTGVKQ